MWAVIIAYLWQDYGYNMIIIIAALQSVPKELKEAAQLDGATSITQFTKVTLPLIKPTILLYQRHDHVIVFSRPLISFKS